jgi:hypothetical protein
MRLRSNSARTFSSIGRVHKWMPDFVTMVGNLISVLTRLTVVGEHPISAPASAAVKNSSTGGSAQVAFEFVIESSIAKKIRSPILGVPFCGQLADSGDAEFFERGFEVADFVKPRVSNFVRGNCARRRPTRNAARRDAEQSASLYCAHEKPLAAAHAPVFCVRQGNF